MILATLMTVLITLGAGPASDVEPADLVKRPDLMGREITVDDRVRFYLESKRNQGFDEIHLRRTDVVFKLPASLKFTRMPTEPVVRARGVLAAEEGRLVFNVRSLELLPADPQRLEQEIGRLQANDFVGRREWALWAERRGQELNEPRLRERGVALETEALWIEANRPGADSLTLAEQASERPILPEVRNALLHRGFRALLSKTTLAPDLDSLTQRIERNLPNSLQIAPGPVPDSVQTAYSKDPAIAYREAAEEVRNRLDRRLLADGLQASLERKLTDAPAQAKALADEARSRLPDRPNVAEQIRQKGLDQVESTVTTLRQSELEDLALVFRNEGHNDRAQRLLQTWLADRRKNRVSASDAEGRIALAQNYARMLEDRATAAELLGEALAIDPESASVTEAYLRLGFRKTDRGWVDPRTSSSPSDTSMAKTSEPEPAAPNSNASDSLQGLTRGEVRTRLGGKPDQIVRSAVQGQCLEQWIYRNPRGIQVINFVTNPGSTEPRSSKFYSTMR